jgi:hypothetical protein
LGFVDLPARGARALTAPKGAKGVMMVGNQAETLRKAIENLINAKLHDALARPGGLGRLIAHRTTGVASPDIRNAERQLEQALAEAISPSECYSNND